MNCEVKDDLMKVEDLLTHNDGCRRKFFVPAYQRGYRWTEKQVEHLIKDILEFKNELDKNMSSKGNEFYCLQPLVTKLVDENKYPNFTGFIEVIDGQQRLTTMLLILQAIHALIRIKDEDEDGRITIYPRRYEIQYETRDSSEVWLNKIKGITSIYDTEAQKLIDENCDYSHLVEVYTKAFELLKDMKPKDLNELRKFIYKSVKFIPYEPKLSTVSNNDIFDDINAGRIDLNNAELVKALLVQESNLKGHENEEYRINAIALEWDTVERTLQDKEFWGFIYSSKHPYTYDTHIEYLLDLLYNKQADDSDNEYYTFDKVNEIYKTSEDKLAFAEEIWGKIKNLFDTLVEWYNNRSLYHRIGYLLEYGNDETVLSLKDCLKGKKKDAQLEELTKRIKDSLSSVKPDKLFYKNPELSQVLFLYNAMAEDKRIGSTARFSFADYKNVKRQYNGWDQEHIASNTDAVAKKGEHKKFARDMIEFFTGEEFPEDVEIDIQPEVLNSLNLEDKGFVERLIIAGNTETYDDGCLRTLFNDILEYFKTSQDGFNENSPIKNGKGTKSEKDFIWNFALLNAGTNRSYGNSLFPVKRKRILNDEFEVYTPVGTRNVFEKAYSRKLTNMMAWTRDDAKAYWEDICRVLKPYIELDSPFTFIND